MQAALRSSARIGLMAIAVFGLGACSTVGASSIPTLPSVTVPTLPSGSGANLGACVDASTFAIIQQLKAPGADVQAILTANKDVLVTGLQTFQPSDPATKAWRDALVGALNTGDMTAAATQIGMLTTSSTITLTSC
jgi:hypothetical protein